MRLTFSRQSWPVVLKVVLIFVAGILVACWLVETPPGLLGKADAIAYAVCHRIANRSFLIDERQFPLCARCTGMYLGALLGLVYLNRRGRMGGMPPLKILIVLGLFLSAFALDGGNSYLHLFPGAPGLYQPQNWLRLVTGTGLGLGIAAVLTPVFNQTVWQQVQPEPALKGFRQLLPLVALAGLLDLAVLSGNPLLLYPLALLGSFTVLLILAGVYSIVWAMLTHQENSFVAWRGMWAVLLAGFTTAMTQIALFDAGRFWLTHTWAGFNF